MASPDARHGRPPRAPFRRWLGVSAGILAGCVAGSSCGTGPTTEGMVQDSTPARVPVPGAARQCDQRFVLLRVEVHTAEGRRIEDARVEVRESRDGALVRVLENAGPDGGYFILDDDVPGPVAPGVSYDVTATADGRTATARVVAGAGPDGCHVALLSGPSVLILR